MLDNALTKVLPSFKIPRPSLQVFKERGANETRGLSGREAISYYDVKERTEVLSRIV